MKSLHGCVCACVYLCVCGCVLVFRRDCEHDARAAECCASESFWSQSRALSLGREQYTWREVCSSVWACLAAAHGLASVSAVAFMKGRRHGHKYCMQTREGRHRHAQLVRQVSIVLQVCSLLPWATEALFAKSATRRGRPSNWARRLLRKVNCASKITSS